MELDSIFLTHSEKENIRNWTYRSSDNSISTEILTPFWDGCLALIPESIAPNILTLSGFICLLQSTFITMNHYHDRPYFVGFLNILLIFAYQTLDALDGKQARKIQSGSPVGEILDHICDSAGLICIVLTMATSLEITSTWTLYLLITIGELVFMNEHLETLNRPNHAVEFDRWTGPGEVLLGCIIVLFLNMIIPFGFLLSLLGAYLDRILAIVLLNTIGKVFNNLIFHTHFYTRDSLIVCILSRLLGAYMLLDYDNLLAVICHSLFWTIMTGDLIVVKMGKRGFHSLVVLMSMATTVHDYLVVPAFIYYFWSVFSSLLNHLNIEMFRPRRPYVPKYNTVQSEFITSYASGSQSVRSDQIRYRQSYGSSGPSGPSGPPEPSGPYGPMTDSSINKA